ncbi:hypothetical protein ACUY4Q_004634 [Phytobacter sp. AG2a]
MAGNNMKNVYCMTLIKTSITFLLRVTKRAP